jgi:hypothetical protein
MQFYRNAIYISPWGCRFVLQVGRYGVRIGRRARGRGMRVFIFAPVTH